MVDRADPMHMQRIDSVNKVLAEIGAQDVPQILIYNQIDRVPGLEPEIVRDSHGKILNIKASAATGQGVELIRAALLEVATAPGDGALATAA